VLRDDARHGGRFHIRSIGVERRGVEDEYPDEMSVTAPTIAPATTVGAVELTVADLARSLDYYRSAIGLGVLEQAEGRAALGAGGTELLRLVELPGARPAPHNTGLFHFALLVPDRPSLARWLAHAAR